MQRIRRNDKLNQNEQLKANAEAQRVLQELHKFLAQQESDGLRVGEMVTVAAELGLLEKPKKEKTA